VSNVTGPYILTVDDPIGNRLKCVLLFSEHHLKYQLEDFDSISKFFDEIRVEELDLDIFKFIHPIRVGFIYETYYFLEEKRIECRLSNSVVLAHFFNFAISKVNVLEKKRDLKISHLEQNLTSLYNILKNGS
jgi:hypothetical protein